MLTFFTRLPGLMLRLADRPYYPGLVALVAASDYFIPGAPSNAIFISSILPRTAQWRTLSVYFAVGCAGGAFLLATLMGLYGEAFVNWVTHSEAAELWARIDALISRFGLFTLAALAVVSAPVRIAVAILALAGYAPLVIAAVVLSGRLVAYPTLAWLVSRFPVLIEKLLIFRPWRHHANVPADAGRQA